MGSMRFNDPADVDSRAGSTSLSARLGQGQFITLYSAWTTTYDPTVDQGATQNITHTLTLSEWRYDGPMIDWCFYLTMTGAGTAANAVFVDLPIPAISGVIGPVFGSGFVYDSSTTTVYPVVIGPSGSTTQVVFWASNAGGSPWGFSPSIALANFVLT